MFRVSGGADLPEKRGGGLMGNSEGREMLKGDIVSTLAEAREIISAKSAFWHGNCSCREERGSVCKKGLHVCLGFTPPAVSSASGSNRLPATREEVEKLLHFAKTEKLVPRPYYNDNSEVTAICFCCPCCCGVIKAKADVAGKFMEVTDAANCANCGACVPVCYFGARKIEDGILKIDIKNCFGCGICVAECPTGAISMVKR